MSRCCDVKPLQPTVPAATPVTVETAFLTVQGMGCRNCAMRVRNSLVMLDGVLDAYVDHETGLAGIRFNPAQVKVQDLIDAVARAGNDGHHAYGASLAALVGSHKRLSRSAASVA